MLVGPADAQSSKLLATMLVRRMNVKCVSGRAGFRREARGNAYGVIVLFSHDGDGLTNEPLLQHCIERVPARPVVHVVTGAHVRFPRGDEQPPNSAVTHYVLPHRASSRDMARLAVFVAHIAAALPAVSDHPVSERRDSSPMAS